MATSELTRQALFNAVENLITRNRWMICKSDRSAAMWPASAQYATLSFSDKYEILDALLGAG